MNLFISIFMCEDNCDKLIVNLNWDKNIHVLIKSSSPTFSKRVHSHYYFDSLYM